MDQDEHDGGRHEGGKEMNETHIGGVRSDSDLEAYLILSFVRGRSKPTAFSRAASTPPWCSL